ncbi:Nramp family divalent metal transporter [Candidatus Tachikawaea gelatinosa]|uniref:Divalent metal cation transporter MntH n=1 Tax=Candidatus Tachikawaea gelatinosa TaxID=1410383 RepID=A0A090AR92_9ENTR|nr:Nramp family divalent metal transporter [Candidatus Tachikawaea gelatinosa]BAP58290.1 divalent metal cation transporter MntH [Candidatus Tachikawaea gelatinosa]
MTKSSSVNYIIKNKKKINLALLGPAFIAAVGYIDPGNFATNIQAGSSYGYSLLWVVVLSNIMAMLIQLISAKLGIATGKNLAEHIRDRFPKKVVWLYWIQAEIIAMATDLAEFIGASLGFQLLFGMSLIKGAIITGFLTFFILTFQNRKEKILEIIIGGFLIFVAGSYIVELIFSQPNALKLTKGMFIPYLPDKNSVFLSAAVLGATIMPHVIYLHSALTQEGDKNTRKERYNATKLDVTIAMTIAGFVNLAMMATSAAVFHFNGYTKLAELDQAFMTLKPLLNNAAATVFGLSLITAGISSTVVGTLAGQVVMQGFIRFNIPLFIRRLITVIPSFIVILIGWNPTKILIFSQVLLSFGIALAIVPLLVFTGNRELMDDMVNTTLTKYFGWLIVILVILLNIYLLICQLLIS